MFLDADGRAVGLFLEFNRSQVQHSFEDTMSSGLDIMLSKDNHYTLFRYEDWPAWVTFTTVFAFLITLDNMVLNRHPQALTISRAIMYTIFWILMACCFCAWVYWYYGSNQAYMWMSGYMLEWMLSFDNLFVFHLIFSVYGCPGNLKHRPLYIGIIGAIFFRLAFIFVGEYLMHAFYFMHIVFGSFLVYTGIKTMTTDDDEDEDPSQHPFVLWLREHMPFVNAYDSKGSFFVRVPVASDGEAILPKPSEDSPRFGEATPLMASSDSEAEHVLVADFSAHANIHSGARFETRATMLFLVVCCLEFSDLLFAVDSVSAIVAQVNDLFLAYTSAVFAMLGLRATFFIIDELVKLFALLKYGVGIVLAFVGVKLIIGHYYHVPASVVCAVLVLSISGSMVASLIQDEMRRRAEGKEVEDVQIRVAKVFC